jgi:hypothetical protein
LRSEKSAVIAAAIVIPIVGAIIQPKSNEIGFAQIDLKRRRLELAGVEVDRNIQRNKDSSFQPVLRRKINDESKEKKAKPQTE